MSLMSTPPTTALSCFHRQICGSWLAFSKLLLTLSDRPVPPVPRSNPHYPTNAHCIALGSNRICPEFLNFNPPWDLTEAAAMDELRFMYTATITIKSNDAVHAAVAASRPAFWSSRRKRRADDFAALDAAVSAQDADFPAQDATKAARTASVVAAQDARRAANFASAAEKSRRENYLAACAARIAVDRATDASAIEAAHIAYVVA